MLTRVYFLAIKKRNIRPGAQYAAKALLVPAGGIGATQQVAVDTDVSFCKYVAQRVRYDLVPVGTGAARAKKIDLANVWCVPDKIGALVLYYLYHFLFC